MVSPKAERRRIVAFSSYRIKIYISACGGTLDASKHDVIFTSPHYPNYYESGDCVWSVETSPGKSLFLHFEDFSIEKCSSCSCAEVKVLLFLHLQNNLPNP